MKNPIVFCAPCLATLLVAPWAAAADYYFGPNGSASAACSEAAPCALNYNMSGKTLQPGDTVYLLGGTYNNQYIRNGKSGTADAWITFKAVDGQLPILKGTGASGCGVEPSSAVSYVRFEGIASTNWGSSGFSNGYNASSSKIEFINCIADGNGVNGIAFYKATGVLIKQSIVAHNGNQNPSWSSGVNLFTAGGTYADNIVDGNVSFENIDISSHRTDGSGFILDENSKGATFINNIGFRNGGSCIRLTNSPGSHIINNTCVGDGIDSNVQYHQEIFYSQPNCETGAVLRNNVLVASAGNKALQGNPATNGNNVTVDGGGSSPFFVSSSNELDFHLVSSATTLIDKGAATEAPSTDIGFDPKCIKQGSPGGASIWAYVIDYEYIASVGGVKGCFKPSTRTGTPDIGAYEYDGVPAPATGGATGVGGTSATGGNGPAGGTSTMNTPIATGGVTASGGTSTTNTPIATGGVTASGGTSAVGGSSAKGGSTAKGGSSATFISDPINAGGNAIVAPRGGSSGNGGTSSISSSAKGGVANSNGGTNGNPGNGGSTAISSNPGNGGSSTGASNPSNGGSNGSGANSSSTVNTSNSSQGGATSTNLPSVGGAKPATSNGSSSPLPVGGATSGTETADDAGGCSCRVAGQTSSSTTLLGIGLLGLLMRRGRRRQS